MLRCGWQVMLHNLTQMYAEQEAVTKQHHYFFKMVFLSGGVVVVQNDFGVQLFLFVFFFPKRLSSLVFLL